MKKILTLKSIVAAALFAVSTTGVQAQAYTENFDNISTLTGSGWLIQNNSSPVGANTWFQGTPTTATPDPGPFNAFNGAVNAYIGVNFASTTGGTGVISNWLVTPSRTLKNGDVFQFYTRKPTIGPGQTDYPDRLEVRMSTNGSSTNVGTGATATGDFTTLLLSINPTLTTNVYPQTWTQYTITISGLPAPTLGRIAFRYFVTSAGPTGNNSDYIGIDNVVYTPYVCPAFTMTAGGALTGGTAGAAYALSLTQTGALGAPSYAITAGALPPGLTLSAGGTISGTPTATGTFNFTGTVSDASGCSGSQSYSITVVCPTGVVSFASVPALCSNGTPYTLTEGSPAGGTYSGTGVSGGLFDPAAGTQTVTYDYTDAYGCAHAASAAVNVNTAPTVGTNASATAVCEGQSVTLSGTGAATYTWDNSVTDGVAFTAADTTYTVTGTDGNGCSNTAMIALTVNPLPVVTASSDAAANTVCAGTSVTLNGGGADTYVWTGGVTDGVAFTPATTDTYTVTGTFTGTGCSSGGMITITVNATPAVSASSDAPANTICQDGTITLSGSGADTYTWDNGVVDNTPFVITGTTTYVVTGTTAATGCTSTDTITVNVNASPSVDLPATPFPYYCEYAGIITLPAGTPAGGTYSGTSVTGDTFDASVGAGSYNIVYSYTDANGCTNTDTEILVVDLCTGIATATAEAGLNVYPNPSTGTFTLAYNQVAGGNLTIRIMDLQGKVVAAETLVNFAGTYNNVFDLSSFDKGIYLIEVTGSREQAHRKVVIH